MLCRGPSIRDAWPQPAGALLLLVGGLIIAHAHGDYQDQKEKHKRDTDTSLVEVVAGYNTSLPCAIQSPLHDAPVLTLWYIGADDTPVYSYDQRSGVSGESWADPEVFEGRAHYLAHLNPPAMLIMRTTVSDAHVYRCRVDFHNSNSRVAWVRLRVIVPPSRVEIVTHVSPVMPGQRDDVVCTAVGGDPPPSVVWLQNGKVVDPNSTVGERGTFNSLEVAATREDLNFPFTCKATNNDVTAPVFAIYYRNVTCGPTSVQIEASESPLVEAREAELTCTAVGSNPPAHLTWYQQGKTIEDVYVNVTRQDNVTVSVLSLIPGRRHHDRQLLCRAENPSLPMATMEDMITLNVAYRPVTRLEVGWPQRPDLMTEGSDLYLECIVDANPHPYKVKFFHNGEEMVHNETAGVEVRTATTTYTVALQRVTRRNSGVYQCLASNVEGDAYSANLTIKIKYAPLCVEAATVVGAGVGERTNITCRVDADPPLVTFSWTFRSAANRLRPRQISPGEFSTDGLTSTLSYRPLSQRDFGELSCHAENTLGSMREPCSFSLVTAGPPEKVINCSVSNVTVLGATVTCLPGFNGGLAQRFRHEVWLESTGEAVFNATLPGASFSTSGLRPDHRYLVSVTAVNARGAARPHQLRFHTLKQVTEHLSLPSRPEPQPLVWVLGVVVGVVVAVVGLMMGLWWTKGRRSSHTLRNTEDDVTKLKNQDLTGDLRGQTDGLCMNGVVQHTIYDASGRYKGFGHLQQCGAYPSCHIDATCSGGSVPATPASRFSFSKKGGRGAAAGKEGAAEGKGGRGSDAASHAGKRNGTGEGGGGEGGEGARKPDGRWRRVISQLSSPHESRFFDICRLAGGKHSQQSQPSESVL